MPTPSRSGFPFPLSNRQPHHPVSRRAVVEQARGMLILLYEIDAEQAFEVLRVWAKETETTVATVSQTLVHAIRLQDDYQAWDRMVQLHVEAAVGKLDRSGPPRPRGRLRSSRARLRTIP
jgi:hypothetical protein